MEFNAARRELQELSLFVWLVMTCSARVGLSVCACAHFAVARVQRPYMMNDGVRFQNG